MQRVEAAVSASISELKKSPSSIIASAENEAVAILNHNRVVAYMVPADIYETMLDRIDDIALVEIAKARAQERGVAVSIDDL